MTHSLATLLAHLQARLLEVLRSLGSDRHDADPDTLFSDLLDSMGMVEFLAVLAEDCAVTPEEIEQCVEHQFGSVADLAAALWATRIVPQRRPEQSAGPAAATAPTTAAFLPSFAGQASAPAGECWLASTAVRLPRTVQPVSAINALLGRPSGWLESHAGIHARRIWSEEDPLSVAAEAGQDCLRIAEVTGQDLGAILVTSEAPPVLIGLAAALHHRLGLRSEAVALEIGGACTGFLSALWLARGLLPRTGPVLVVTVEAPSRYLEIQPGPAGEAAALLGDASAACLVCARPAGPESVPLGRIILGADGSGSGLAQVVRSRTGLIELCLEGSALAGRAVRTMAQAVRQLAQEEGRSLGEFKAVIVHGGNGRLPDLVARQLGLAPDSVWSETPRTANLGSASLPVAWAAHEPRPHGPVAWTAVGAGLTWAAGMTGGHSPTARD